jgi:3-hydroxy-9,10-secoandrosta-1,3,5(10)-triene-9,17-dione monooxygenase
MTARAATALVVDADAPDLVARAEALVPDLAARSADAERLRRLPEQNVAALRRAGLLKVLQPRRCGGFETSLRTHVDVVAALARGCASTAWCAGVIHAHSWLMGLFPQQAQDDAYGSAPDAVIAAVIAPRGAARRVDDGYQLNGTWAFCSGAEHAQWLLLGAAVHDPSGAPVDEGELLVPVRNVTIKDDWHVVGLRGTGSCGIVAKDVYVPGHRFLSLRQAGAGTAPGIALHGGALYRAAAVPVLVLALTPAAVGTAEAALQSYIGRLPGREVAYTLRQIQSEWPVTHVQLAAAATKIATARRTLHHCADEIQAAAERGGAMALAERARMRMECAWAVRLCLEAVEALMLGSGGSGIAEANPVQRAWRDLHAVSMHGALNLAANQELYGRVLLGLPPNTPML